eukprot:tig00001128_g7184.t1
MREKTYAAAVARQGAARAEDSTFLDTVKSKWNEGVKEVKHIFGIGHSEKEKQRAGDGLPVVPRCYEYAESRRQYRTATITYEDPSAADGERVAAVAAVGTFGPDPDLHWAREVPLAAIPSARGVLWKLRMDLPLRRVFFRFRVRYEGGAEALWRSSVAHDRDRDEPHQNNFLDVHEASALPRSTIYDACSECAWGSAPDGDSPWSLVACLFAASRLLSGERLGSLKDAARALKHALEDAGRESRDRGREARLSGLLFALDGEAAVLRELPALALLSLAEPRSELLQRTLCPLGLDSLEQLLEASPGAPLRALVVTFMRHSVLAVWGGPLPPGRPLLLDPLPCPDELSPDGSRASLRLPAALEFEGAGALRAYLSRELFGGRVLLETPQDELNSVVRLAELSLGPPPAAGSSAGPSAPPSAPLGRGDAIDAVRERERRQREEEEQERRALAESARLAEIEQARRALAGSARSAEEAEERRGEEERGRRGAEEERRAQEALGERAREAAELADLRAHCEQLAQQAAQAQAAVAELRASNERRAEELEARRRALVARDARSSASCGENHGAMKAQCAERARFLATLQRLVAAGRQRPEHAEPHA